jgi:ketosteroid isomerase-like protein
MSADIELLRSLTEAWNRGDIDTLRAHYAPDMTADPGELWPASVGRVYGVDEVLAAFESGFAIFDRVEVIAEDYIERGEAIVVPTRWCGTMSGSDTVIEQPVVAVYRVRDGRVASIDYFRALDAALAAAEAPPPPSHPPDAHIDEGPGAGESHR